MYLVRADIRIVQQHTPAAAPLAEQLPLESELADAPGRLFLGLGQYHAHNDNTPHIYEQHTHLQRQRLLISRSSPLTSGVFLLA